VIARVETSSIMGIEAVPIQVEVDVSSGLPAFGIVGLPDAACRESQARVRSAIRSSGYHFPPRKITVNLAPADLKKEGAAFDLPIAVGILAASEQLGPEALDGCVMAGELALDGRLRPIPGVLSRASALMDGSKRLVFPYENHREAQCVATARLAPVRDLRAAVAVLEGAEVPAPPKGPRAQRPAARPKADFAEVRGQVFARRAIEVAAAGGHNLLMIGPPGSGKTMLAKRIPSILTELAFEEAVETTKIHSVAGLLKSRESLIRTPPFRTPHHTISDAAMVGGGTLPRPGEISLAHNGVLFLDELPEFRRNVLEVLRQPLEEGRIVVSRAALSLTFPAQFMLVGAMNPCPCGYFTDRTRECTCSSLQIKQYLGKISGPLLDRIDLHLGVEPLRPGDFAAAPAEPSEAIRERVRAAREIQRRRYGDPRMLNSRLEGKEAEAHCVLSEEAGAFLRQAIEGLGFSGRAYHKILKVGRTIADLEGKPLVERPHIQEAVQYRGLDRRGSGIA
jgi:magnesium chelatase family protein